MKPKDIKTVRGECEISLNRHQTNDHKAEWTLRVEDCASRTMVAEFVLDGEAFSNLLSTRIAVADMKLYQSDLHGCVHENHSFSMKHDGGVVYQNDQWARFFAAAQKKCAAELGPEWKLDDERGWNGHRSKNGHYEFTARRWVKP